MSSQEFIQGASFEQERPRELVENLGAPYDNFMSNLVNRATTYPSKKATVVVVGGLSETGKTALVTQAEADFSDNYQVQRFEESVGQRFQHLHMDLGDGMNLFRNCLQTRIENGSLGDSLIMSPKQGEFTPANYAETAAIMTNVVSYAAVNTDRPRVIWLQATLLPGLLEPDGQIDGLDKGLSTAASLAANLDALTAIVFGSSQTRMLGASFKEEMVSASPDQVPAILEKYKIHDTRKPQEIIDYTRDHSSNAKTRVQSLEMVEHLMRKMIASGEIQPPDFEFGDNYDNDEMQYLKLEYAPAFLRRLYGGEVRRDRAFTMYNNVFIKGQTLHVDGSIYENESLVGALEKEAGSTPIALHRELLYTLGIRQVPTP